VETINSRGNGEGRSSIHPHIIEKYRGKSNHAQGQAATTRGDNTTTGAVFRGKPVPKDEAGKGVLPQEGGNKFLPIKYLGEKMRSPMNTRTQADATEWVFRVKTKGGS